MAHLRGIDGGNMRRNEAFFVFMMGAATGLAVGAMLVSSYALRVMGSN
jgi:hypothetical protein